MNELGRTIKLQNDYIEFLEKELKEVHMLRLQVQNELEELKEQSGKFPDESDRSATFECSQNLSREGD